MVPYRQCKLTELLFSNSFPSAGQAQAPRRNPQKGVMVVTADGRGDFNATSQILRYSALAREVTVPRVPSITATILAHGPTAATATTTRPFGPGGCTRTHTPPGLHMDERETMEIAALEIARMSDELEQQRDELERQSEARLAAEAHLLSMEERMLELEAAVRDECATEFEQRLGLELARFRASLALEQERSDEHWDRKVDVLERGLDSGSHRHDEADKENVLVEDAAQEAERLRRENTILRRELAARSPSKRMPLAERDDFARSLSASPSSLSLAAADSPMASVTLKLERMRIGSAGPDGVRAVSSGSPSKKARRLPAKRWEELHLEDHDRG